MSKLPLQEWLSANKPSDELNYKNGYWQQGMFVRDELASLVGHGLRYNTYKKMGIDQVISTHRSKSVVLPVYLLQRPDLGLQIVLRNNFHNWKMSVISETPIIADFAGLFHTTPPIEPDYTGDPLHQVYFEGFPSELIFGYYETSDRKQWSAEISGDHAVWMTIFLIMKSLGVIKPRQWHTQESHKRELEEDRKEWKAERKVK